MRILSTLAVTMLCVPAVFAQAPAAAPTMAQKTAAARPEIKRLSDAFDFKGAQAVAEALLPTTKPVFDKTSVRSADVSTRAYVDYCVAYFMAYQAADNAGQWEKGLEHLNTALDLAKESVDNGKAKLTEARDDYKKMADDFKGLLDKNAEAIALVKAKAKLEDYEESTLKISTEWTERLAEGNKWAAFFQYDLDLATRTRDDFQKYVDTQKGRIKDQQDQIAKFCIQLKDKKIKDKELDEAVAAYQEHPGDKAKFVEGVLSSAAYMNSFTDKADKLQFVHRLHVLDPENPKVAKSLEDIMAGKSGAEVEKAPKAKKK